MSGGVFICYRREESAFAARAIHDRVVRQLERENVFLDVDNIDLGVDWFNVLTERVGACDALVAAIGRNWVSAADKDNRRRIDDPDDFVRIEIEAALKRDVRVIPVLVDGAVMPKAGELPDSLKGLARRQGLEVSPARFDADVEKLTHALGSILEQRRACDVLEATRPADEELQTRQGALKAEQAECVRGRPQVDAARQAWRNTVLNACRDLSNSKIMIGQNITPKILSDCRELAKVPEADEIIAVDQNQLFNSFHLIVIGYKGLYWHVPLNEPRHMTWSELKTCDMSSTWTGVVHLGKYSVSPQNISAKQFITLLRFLIEQPGLPA